MTDPDEKDSLTGGDALSDEKAPQAPAADESLVDDSPLNAENDRDDAQQVPVPPPAD